MSPALRATALAAGALALLLGPASANPAPDSAWRHPSGSLDLTTSAHPTEATRSDSDQAMEVSSARSRSVHAHTSALASADCDGCRGNATSLQVLYVHHASNVTVDNAAVAWSQCVDCGSTALSVQVVVLDGGHRIKADNRAFAANAACSACNTAALAYQLVVASPRRAHLSKSALRDLRHWVAAQSAALRGPGSPFYRQPTAKARRAAGTLANLVNGDLGSRTRGLDVQRR